MLRPSLYQQAIFDFVKQGRGSAVIEAVAGSGKTTTIVEALKLIPPTERVVFLAFNKALRNDQPVLTGTGWRPIASLAVGDKVIGVDGKSHNVTKLHHVGIRPMREVVFSDGTVIVADAGHLWKTETINYAPGEGGGWRKRERWKVRTTDEIWQTLHLRHRVPHVSQSVHFDDRNKKKLPLDPYLLGAIIGDGSFKHRAVLFASVEREMIELVRDSLPPGHEIILAGKTTQHDWRIVPKKRGVRGGNIVMNALRTLGLLGHGAKTKFVPHDYLFASPADRLSLLQGLMDTDGCANGVIAPFVTTSARLAEDVRFIAGSLGGIASIRKIEAPDGGISYWVNVRLRPGLKPFRLSRKILKWRVRTRNEQTPRKIVQIRAIDDAEATCISIDAPDHLFLTTAFIPTHNSIATELQKRVPAHVSARTLNSLGHGAWTKFAGKFCQLDSNKTRTIIREALTEDEQFFEADIRKLVSLAKAHGLVPAGVRGATGLMRDTLDNWIGMIDTYDLDIEENDKEFVVACARRVLTVSLSRRDLIDFDDQLYMTVAFNVPVYRFDWVFVDEAQDVSPIQRALLKKALKPGGRLVAVGDSRQAIYHFRGADSASMDNIAQEFGCVKLPLSISYRCPKSVVMYAQQIVGHIQAADTAPDGEVMCWPEYTADQFQTDDLMICRNTAPLIGMAYSLIGRRVPVRVLGREIGQGLVTLIEKLKPKGIHGDHGLLSKLSLWLTKEIERHTAKGNDAKADAAQDKYDTISTFINESRAQTVPQLILEIQQLFVDDNMQRLTLATVHKAKGLEAPRVFILDPDLMPSKYARQEQQMIQEQNLIYVAVTRAKETLVFINSKDMKRPEQAKAVAA
ncbi:MAG: UvrD-helicase domain-containing protein [Sulfuricaulis sp.]